MHTTHETVSASTGDLDELADYFDRTDAGESPWEPASDVAIARLELEQVSLRLPKEDLAALKQRAAKLGVGYTTLIRMVVRHYLANPLAR